jgi:hypothetical protein
VSGLVADRPHCCGSALSSSPQSLMKLDRLSALLLQSAYGRTANACPQNAGIHQIRPGRLAAASCGRATSAPASGEIPEAPPPYALQCDPWRQSRPWVSIHSRLVDLLASWAQLSAILACKAENAGGECIQVDPQGTSQTCPGCMAVSAKKLSRRIHRCDCGCVLDRDVAAAMVVHYRAFNF